MSLPLWVVHTSPSRKPLFDGYFLPSWNACGMGDLFELKVIDAGADTLYGTDEFNALTQRRIENIELAYNDNDGRMIVSSGDDLYFYGPAQYILNEFTAAMRYTRIAAMQDTPDVLCVCLVVGVSNLETRRLMEAWRNSSGKYNGELRDQERFGYCLKETGISFGRLPLRFWSHGRITGQRFIDDELALPNPPKDILIGHSNYAIGVDVKVRLTEAIRKKVEARQFCS